MLESKFIKLKNYTAHYLEAGKGENLILLHGWSIDAEALTPIIKELSINFRVLTPDLLGFGRSSKLPLNANLDTMTDFIFEFIKIFNFESFCLCGISMGGTLSLKILAGDQDRKIKKAVIISGGTQYPEDLKKSKFKFTLKRFHEALSVYISGFHLITGFYLLRSILRNYLIHSKALAQVLNKSREKDLLEIRNSLDQIKTSTLLVWAEKDSIFPLEQGYFLKDHIVNSALKIIPGAQHPWSTAQPKLTSNIVTEFLKKA